MHVYSPSKIVLAEEIARGTEGVTKVHNELRVVAGTRDANRQQSGNACDFGDFVDDATITAGVKSELKISGRS